MKAFTKVKYGGPEVIRLEEVEIPVLKEDQLLVKVMANSANPADWHILRGKPFFARFTTGLFKPKEKILGADFAGIVEQVGNRVTEFKEGDRVFGEALTGGAFAQYTAVQARNCAEIPSGFSFTDFACVPIAGLTAYQAIKTHGKLQSGESVLINGSSGGVGHIAVQIAVAMGAQVTAVCSSKNVNFVHSLGAQKIIAYDEVDIHKHQLKYDLVIDTHGNLNFSDFQRMGQRGVMVGFTTMGQMMSVLLSKAFSRFPLTQFTAQANSKDLKSLAELIKDKKLKVCIQKTFKANQIPEAIGYIESMRTQGKVAMVWD